MPISQKIIEQIKNINIPDDEKYLMINILKIEDKGTHRYKNDYEKAIKDYLKEHPEESGK